MLLLLPTDQTVAMQIGLINIWALVTGTGICKGALHNNTVETELNLAAEKAENKEGDRHGRRGFGGSAGFFCCCCGGQKRAKDIGKALFCQLLCQGRRSSLHHTVASQPATGELSTGGQLLLPLMITMCAGWWLMEPLSRFNCHILGCRQIVTPPTCRL